MSYRYFLTRGDGPKLEVTQDEFLAAERLAGFVPKPGCGPASTGGFSGTVGFLGGDERISGTVMIDLSEVVNRLFCPEGLTPG